MAGERDSKRAEGLRFKTLLISSAAAVAAALIVPYFWERGTLVATAVTPVIVAVVTELLNRPVQTVGKVVEVVTVAPLRARTDEPGAADVAEAEGPEAAPTDLHPGAPPRGAAPAPDLPADAPVLPAAEAPPAGTPPRSEDPFGLYAPERRRRGLRIAVLTGLAAFAIVAVAFTFTELVFTGDSITGDRRTTIFGGSGSSSSSGAEESPTPSATGTATGTATRTPSATATPSRTPTASATPTPTATATATETPPAALGAEEATPTVTAAP